MISKNDKQAILNGAYGITRSGRKCKYVGLSNQPVYPYVFIYFDSLDKITETKYVDETLLYRKNDITDFDVIGLWADKPEPFNLYRALAGDPVKLRCGYKAYVKYIMSDEYSGSYPLHGYMLDPHEPDGIEVYKWTNYGNAFELSPKHEYDIVSMWKEPKPQQYKNVPLNTLPYFHPTDTVEEVIGLQQQCKKQPEPVSKNITVTLPRALRKPKDKMWFVDSDGPTRSSYGKNIQLGDFEKIPYFGSEADAKAWFDAMQGSRK